MQEAVDAGVKLDFNTYIYLTTLLKPEIPRFYKEMEQHARRHMDAALAAYVPDSEAIVQLFSSIQDSGDVALLERVIEVIKERQAKLDVPALEALITAFNNVGRKTHVAETFLALHKAYLIDTPTFDAFNKLHPELSAH